MKLLCNVKYFMKFFDRLRNAKYSAFEKTVFIPLCEVKYRSFEMA